MSDRDSAELLALRWALSPAGRLVLDGQASFDLRRDPAEGRGLIERLRELRRRAARKLDEPERWWLTERGLQQASSSRIARYKAERLDRLDPAPQRRWIDLGCGIGGDLIALAQRVPTVAVERDPLLVELLRGTIADHRLAERIELLSIDLGGKESVAGECQDAARSDAERLLGPVGATITAWHCDPDRRVDERRSIRVEHHSPPLDWLRRLMTVLPIGCLKEAPASDLTAFERFGEREWIGDDGECKQQLVWCAPSLCDSPWRQVTLLDRDEPVIFRFRPTSVAELPVLHAPPEPGSYLFEPHAACFAAEGIGALGLALQATRTSREGGYLTCDQRSLESHALEPRSNEPRSTDAARIASRCGAWFRVLRNEGLDTKRLRRAVRELEAGTIEWKKRGIPASWLDKVRDLTGTGTRPLAALVYRTGGKTVVTLAERCRAPVGDGSFEEVPVADRSER
ncbi:MAG TPA: hypothetical protein PLI18_12585 [Pirellulaceae bacterium]|nr:hypothetical protein [Pirellulaceae bacterium]